MSEKLRWQTISDSVARILKELMRIEELSKFRLVGGTSLSLQLGHRESYDIDMFTDQEYGSVDWKNIDRILRDKFSYVSNDTMGISGMGITQLVGTSDAEIVKLDMYYTDPFIQDELRRDGVRLAGIEDIAAMKLRVISAAGRKKDFWDIHEMLERYELKVLLGWFSKRYPYLEAKDVIKGLTYYNRADDEADPVCFKGKFWDLIKIDLEAMVQEYRKK